MRVDAEEAKAAESVQGPGKRAHSSKGAQHHDFDHELVSVPPGFTHGADYPQSSSDIRGSAYGQQEIDRFISNGDFGRCLSSSPVESFL